MKIPSFVSRLLWDVKKTDLTAQSENFIIERVLEYVDFNALNWITDTFGKKEIVKVLITSKKYHLKQEIFLLYTMEWIRKN